MTSIHQLYAEKSDVIDIYNLLIHYKETDLVKLNYPEVDRGKGLNFINTILQKGKIILLKDLDTNQLIGCCMFNKSEYFFSKTEIMMIQMIYIKQEYRNFKIVKQMIDSVKKISGDMQIVLSITSGLGVDPVFEKLGFENMGGNWRLI